jgi:hypothetical protein
MICLSPVVRDDPRATLTQEVLQKHVKTVVPVRHELGRPPQLVILGRVIVVIVVQAVDEVGHLDLCEVAVGACSPALGNFGQQSEILPELQGL